MAGEPRYTILVYLKESQRPIAALLFILPILLVYEAGVQIMAAGRSQVVVNTADAILKRALEALGIYGPVLSALCIVVTLLLLQGLRQASWRVHGVTFLGMVLESVILSLPLFALDRAVQYALGGGAQGALAAGQAGLGLVSALVLSLGAGVYEEFLFRLVLLGGLLAVLGRKDEEGERPAWVQPACVLVSALLFAGFHHLPPLGDEWRLGLFAFRTVAGVYFAWVYLARGLGLAVGCHACYDVLVVGLRVWG